MKNCEMILAGFGGQGILFTGKILAFAAMLKDKKLSWLPSYGPEMRGGTANCHVIIDDEPIGSPIVTRPNILVAMNKPSLDKFENTVSDGGYVFIDTSLIDRNVEREDVNEICVNATETAHNIGNKSLANMVMLGAVLKKTELFTIDEIEYTMKKSLPENKHKHQCQPPSAARAMPAMIYSTHGTGTLLPKALYRAESEAPGRSVHPSGNP